MLNKTSPNSHTHTHTHSHFLHIRNVEYISAWALRSSHIHPEKKWKKEREEGGREGGGEERKAGEMKEENWG